MIINGKKHILLTFHVYWIQLLVFYMIINDRSGQEENIEEQLEKGKGKPYPTNHVGNMICFYICWVCVCVCVCVCDDSLISLQSSIED